MRVTYDELRDALSRALVRLGFRPERAERCASLFADSSRDGVYSHGLNRFPRFIATIRNGVVDIGAEPGCVARFGAFERWDGHRGPGNLNAFDAMARAIALARDHGVGSVALANTNHWMRGGSYGWQAADAGAVGICWTNTLPNLPPYGAADPRIGNNPFVVAVPRARGHVVLDMALSQFSIGALASYRSRNERLPVAGGYDVEGKLTCDAAAIEMSGRLLPIGFWKGSGLSIVLDMVGALLSGGRATWQIPVDPERETGLSQVFVAFDLSAIAGRDLAGRVADEIIDHVGVRYPGGRTLETRTRNLAEGVPVEPSIWREVQELAA
jgi:3-dehydro-L-gulonate 2-dehydrogenase